jgi:L-methionine (R)-S-oxide reductase
VTQDATTAPFHDLGVAPPGPPPSEAQRGLAPGVAARIARGDGHEAVLDHLVEAVHAAFPAYAWTGIYVTRGDALELGPFRGPDSPHHRIRIGTGGVGAEGICGWVAAHGVPQVIPDVNADPRYLMCSASIRSEIVVPIAGDGGRVLGVIDIDSETPALFTATDLSILAELARLIAPTFPGSGPAPDTRS